MPLAQAVASHDFLLFDVTTTDLGSPAMDGRPPDRIMWPIVLSTQSQGGWHQPARLISPSLPTTVAALPSM